MYNLVVKDLIFDKEAIKNLYEDNKWYAYTNDIESLYNGFQHSESWGAYIDNQLLGLIRIITDQNTILYIQDILVFEKYHRQGIGQQLMDKVLHKYGHCRQIVLVTDDSLKTRSFYEKLGFVSYEQVKGIGFIYKK